LVAVLELVLFFDFDDVFELELEPEPVLELEPVLLVALEPELLAPLPAVPPPSLLTTIFDGVPPPEDLLPIRTPTPTASSRTARPSSNVALEVSLRLVGGVPEGPLPVAPAAVVSVRLKRGLPRRVPHSTQ
jgi:hypothetical protein